MNISALSDGIPGVGVIGCGYWGRNLVRNFYELGALRAVSDSSKVTTAEMTAAYDVPALSLETILSDTSIDAVAIATPAVSHARICDRALDAGKHVFVEKPLALRVFEAEGLCEKAKKANRILMVGHLLQYHPAFLELKNVAAAGNIGRVQYLYSNRLNLGKIRREEDILWSFAPHDISMILSLVQAEPENVWAVGGRFLHKSIADVTTTHLAFPGGEKAHIFVSWLHPYKEQKLVVVGEQGMLVFNDGESWQNKLTLYQHRIEWRDGLPIPVKAGAEPIAVESAEPLQIELQHFLDCIANGERPRTDGYEGIRVLRVLEAASRSLVIRPPTERAQPDPDRSVPPLVHPSSYIDDGCEIGEGTRIWHFCHILPGSRIGKNCSIGENVVVGPNAAIGDNCTLKDNVSVCEGVILEEGVYCGSSCVFTDMVNAPTGVDRADELRTTVVRRGARLGANSTIGCGHTIGRYASIGAGALITSDVPDYALMEGVPARRVAWMSRIGNRLDESLVCPGSGERYRLTGPDAISEWPGE